MARAAAGAGFANVTTASSATLEALVEAAVRAVCRRCRERYNGFEYRPFFSFLRGISLR